MHRVEPVNADTAAGDVCKPVSIFHLLGLFFHAYPRVSVTFTARVASSAWCFLCPCKAGLLSIQLSSIEIYCKLCKALSCSQRVSSCPA